VADGDTQQIRPRRRWGRRLLTTVIVLLVLLGAGLAVVDRVAAGYAERRIGDQVAKQLVDQKATSAPPEVTITGVPFLTQVLDGRYKEIKILLRDFAGPAGQGRTVKVPLLDIRAQNVLAPLDKIRAGNGDVTVSTVTGVGTIDYASLAALVDRKGVKLGEKDGKLTVAGPLTALGQTFNLTGTASLTVKSGVVQVRVEGLTGDGLAAVPLVQNLITAYAKQISVDIKLPQLPLKLVVQKVEPRPEGLVVTAGAENVALNSGGL
jgi:hypothetical protein